MKFYQLIRECKTTVTHAGIRRLLYQHQDNLAIKELFRLMLDKSIVYNIKKVPSFTLKYPQAGITTDRELAQAINQLLYLDLRGDELKVQVKRIAAFSIPELREVLRWVLDRGNPAKVGKSFVNLVWPGLIRVQPYMGAVPGTEEALDKLPWETGVNVQDKIDGMTLIVHYKDSYPVELRTRQGQDITKYFPTFMARQKMRIGFNGFVHHEGLVYNPTNGFMHDRQTGNGLINKAIKNGEIRGDVDDSIHSVLLDMYDEDFPGEIQEQRYWTLGSFIHDRARRVLQQRLHTVSDARSYAQTLIKAGGEGVICKNPDMPFKDGKPTFNVKIKNEFTVELQVIDYKLHSKRLGWIGSLLCVSADGGLQVWVTPKNDADKQLSFITYWQGNIVSVKAESIIKSKGKKTVSLLNPRFDGEYAEEYVRDDKAQGDTYPEIVEQERASKEA